MSVPLRAWLACSAPVKLDADSELTSVTIFVSARLAEPADGLVCAAAGSVLLLETFAVQF
jgi:hypothetical protein